MYYPSKLQYCFALAAILAFSITSSNAQRRKMSHFANKDFTYGPAAGMTISNFDINHSSSSQFMFGYYAGGFCNYNFTRLLSAQAEVNFNVSGGEQVSPSILFTPSSPILKDVSSIDLKLFGVEVPVSLKFRITQYVPEMYVAAGISGMYILKSQAKLERIISNGTSYGTTSTYLDVTSKVQDMQASGIVGVGANFSIAKYELLVNAAFNFGLTDLSANNVVINNAFRSKAFKVGIGLSF